MRLGAKLRPVFRVQRRIPLGVQVDFRGQRQGILALWYLFFARDGESFTFYPNCPAIEKLFTAFRAPGQASRTFPALASANNPFQFDDEGVPCMLGARCRQFTASSRELALDRLGKSYI